MKAVIMAGGEGSRLRPLTCDRPKPMVPLMNKPTMEYIVNLLKKHGITEIGVTLQYLPEAIMDYFGDGKDFGVNLQYFIEEEPLGTAGSVKNGEHFLDETFMVISGDALTDFDLQKAMDFHREKKSLATLVLTTVENPLEYGVVITEKTGEIARFLEKPSWGEVFSDRVNTGIYILEPEVLAYVPAKKKYDFSQELFPKLLDDKKPMYGCTLEGYWCDIGNLEQYQQAHFDILDGKVDIELEAKEVAPGVWLEEGVEISPEACVKAPVYIGKGTKVNQGVTLDAYSILGKHNLISSKASIKKSILWDNNYLGSQTQLRGSTLCHKVQVKDKGNLYEGSVIGDATLINEGATVKPGTKVWPYKKIDAGAIINESLIWGSRGMKNLFGLKGIRGLLNQDITPEFASKLGAAYGSLVSSQNKVVISADNWPGSAMLKQSLIAGLVASGVKAVDIGTGITSMTRLTIQNQQAFGGIHVKQCPEEPNKVSIQFFNKKGANISKGEERKLENLLAREDFKRSFDIGSIEQDINALVNYANHIHQNCFSDLATLTNLKVMVGYQGNNIGEILGDVFAKAGCQVIFSEFSGLNHGKVYLKDTIKTFANSVRFNHADLGVFFDNNGETITLVDEMGEVITDEELQVINSILSMEKSPGSEVVVPTTAPMVIESLANKYNCKVKRTKTAPQTLMEAMENLQFNLYADGVFNLAAVLDYLGEKKKTLSELKAEIPPFYTYQQEIYCPWEAKGKVIRKLVEEYQGQNIEMIDGVKVFHDSSWSLILPDSEKPCIKIYSEGITANEAKLLNEMYCDMIETLKA